MNRKIVAITVSVNFASVLELVIPLNIKHFEKWYIITDWRDRNTIDLCEKYGKGVIELIYFAFSAEGRLFNKGGGLNQGQLVAHSRHPGFWFLILDADILLPDNLGIHVDRLRYYPDILYGVENRYDYPSMSALESNRFGQFRYGGHFTGFFQLYADEEKYYEESHGIDKCDDLFREKFVEKRHMRGLYVKHLGRSGLGSRYLISDRVTVWDGTIKEGLFLRDRKINIQDLKYEI